MENAEIKQVENLPTCDYQKMGTVELRTLVRERGLAKGSAVASANKADLIALLNGTGTLEAPTLPASDELADVLARLMNGRVKSGVDAEAVTGIFEEFIKGDTFRAAVQEAAPAARLGFTVNMPELGAPVEMEGEAVHCQFSQVLSWLRADVPLWLWGQPGGGKTHLGRQLAKALGIPCFVMSIDPTTTANKLLGFQNLVSGAFVPGWLYEPYKNGGLVVVDEIDTGDPGILAGLNALTSNSHYLFPNGETVQKHANFRLLACANTKGTGAVAGFTARQRLDAATLNRFAIIEYKYDEGLEMQLACGIPSQSERWAPCQPANAADCEAWVRWVQSVRAHCGKSVLVSPRPSLMGVKALRAGIPASEVADALIFALCASDTVDSINGTCGRIESKITRKAV